MIQVRCNISMLAIVFLLLDQRTITKKYKIAPDKPVLRIIICCWVVVVVYKSKTSGRRPRSPLLLPHHEPKSDKANRKRRTATTLSQSDLVFFTQCF